MSKWYSFKELKRARTPMLLDSVTGLPDNHVITVVERVISVDDSELIQNNVRTDTFTLNLDAEYDDLNVVVIFTKPNNINVKVAYNGTPTHIPGSAMELVGSLACSVVGIDADGEVRAVTKAAPDTFQVVKSGAYDGSVTSDDAELLGQILQAVSDAEAAITEAETATTAATNATSQATSAATSANQAASSANSAASSANSAATRATSAAVNAENAYDTLQPYMATIDSCANILHSEVGPDSVVTADDSFPCKPVEMVVYGNTVQNLWVNPSGTNNGVTVTSNEDGTITFSGTSTGNFYIYSTIYSLKPGSTYTLSIDNATTANISIQPYNSDGYISDIAAIGDSGFSTRTASFPQNATYARLMIQGVSGRTFSGTYRIMLNEGDTAEPWCPPGLNSVGQLREDEKNLWVNPSDGTQSGITYTVKSDGSVTVSGTSTDTVDFRSAKIDLAPGKTYALSIDKIIPGLTDQGFYLFDKTAGVTYYLQVSGGASRTVTIVAGHEYYPGFYLRTAGVSVSGTYKVMLNEGSTVRPWVAPGTESAVQVVTAGKNLFNAATNDQGHINVGPDGAITLGAGFSWVTFDVQRIHIPKGTKITLSKSVALGANCGPGIWLVDRSGHREEFSIYSSLNENTHVAARDYEYMQCFVNGGTVTLDTPFYVQLGLGSTATDYEPPNITTTPIDLQGHTLNSLPDGTRDELHIDGGGNVVLEKRVAYDEITADDLSDAGKANYVEALASERYKSGAMGNVSSKDVMNDFAIHGNPDAIAGLVAFWTYSLDGRNRHRMGNGKTESSSSAQLQACKTLLGTRTVKVQYAMATPKTISLGTIAPPTMAAPNVTAYVADDTPAEIELDYVRDINVVVDRLEKKVAGLAVMEATNV